MPLSKMTAAVLDDLDYIVDPSAVSFDVFCAGYLQLRDTEQPLSRTR